MTALPPARSARLSAGLPDASLVAKRLRISRPYLLRLERTGSWPVHLAERGARLYGCDEKTLLYPTPGREARRGKRAARPRRRRTAGAAGVK